MDSSHLLIAMIESFARPFPEQLWDKIHRSPRLRKGGKARDQRDSRIGICVIHGWSVFGGPDHALSLFPRVNRSLNGSHRHCRHDMVVRIWEDD
jgi:hypothetical protein